MEWRDSLRANLSLWPNLTANLAALSSCSGKTWDESKFLEAIKKETDVASKTATSLLEDIALESEDSELAADGKVAKTSRTVRQTIEIMILSGLAYRDEENLFHLTRLGETLLSFLRIGPNGQSVANSANVHLAGRLLIPGLLAVPEYRSIVLLCAEVDGWITTEETNRAVRIMSMWSYPEANLLSQLASKIKTARDSNDVTKIGPRWYRDEDYGTSKASDQRKAVNPWLLLAGGGGLVLTSGDQYERRIHPLLIDEVMLRSRSRSLPLPILNKNIVENSRTFAEAFSKICL